MFIKGQPIYPNTFAADVYEVPYGPLLFILNGVAIKAAPSILSSKVCGIICFIAALIILWRLMRQASQPRDIVFIAFGCVAALFIYMPIGGAYVFWNRPEPFLLLLGLLSLLVLTSFKPRPAAFTIGILAGCAVGFKIHGGIYLVPAALALIGPLDWRNRIKLAAIMAPLTALTIAAPFVWFNKLEELSGYVSVLVMASKQKWLLSLLIDNILLSMSVLLPSLYLLLGNLGISSRNAWLLLGLIISFITASIIGSISGAGIHHLIPLIPMAIYLCLALPAKRGHLSVDHAVKFAIIATSLSFLFPYVYVGVRNTYSASHRLFYISSEYSKRVDVEHINDKYPDAQVGIGDDQHFDDSFYKILPILRGGPLRIDFSSWMDFQYEVQDDHC